MIRPTSPTETVPWDGRTRMTVRYVGPLERKIRLQVFPDLTVIWLSTVWLFTHRTKGAQAAEARPHAGPSSSKPRTMLEYLIVAPVKSGEDKPQPGLVSTTRHCSATGMPCRTASFDCIELA